MIRAIALSTLGLTIALGGGTAAASLALSAKTSGLIKPVQGATVSQRFGCTSVAREPVDLSCASGHWHSGLDLAAARGTPVLATMTGIASVIHSPLGYGLHVVIDHGGGLSSVYGHLDTVTITSGSFVDGGEVIGTVGSSGNSSGPHLHFEIRRDGISEDPRLDLVLP